MPEASQPPYPILDPTDFRAERNNLCALAIMAKAPRPGRVKTRLAPPLTLDQSAALNIAFLKDTAANIASVRGAVGVLCYTPVGDEEAFRGIAPAGFCLIPQREGDFGVRLYRAAADLLACGFGSVCLIDSDSPTLPHSALQDAADELARPGDRIVLGGSHDGGYYLIGLKEAHTAPFERITWSTGVVFAETLERCAEAGLPVAHLPTWYDVDDGDTLRVLASELLDGRRPHFASVDGYNGEHTRAYLAQLASSGEVSWRPAAGPVRP